MDSTVDEFIWVVPAEGFRWVTAPAFPAKRARWLTDGRPDSWRIKQEEAYRPLKEHTGLFLMFAKIEPTEEGVLKFANRFGSLLRQTSPAMPVPLRGDAADSEVAMAERLDLWQGESRDMKALTEVWAAIRDNDRPKLEPFVQANTSENPAWRALDSIQAHVNPRLERHVGLELRRDPSLPEAKLCLTPKNLLGAIWLQFGLAVEGRKEFRDCAQCGEPFEVSRDGSGKRTDARFCRPACRVTHYRGRIETAWQLHQQHLPYAQIARRLDTDTDTVKSWISTRAKDGEKTRKK